MKVRDLVEAIRMEFMKELQAKTGWGRNEVEQAFERAVKEALYKIMTDIV